MGTADSRVGMVVVMALAWLGSKVTDCTIVIGNIRVGFDTNLMQDKIITKFTHQN
jgi:hypothetical protein